MICFIFNVSVYALVLNDQKEITKKEITLKEEESRKQIEEIKKQLEKRLELLQKKNILFSKILALSQASLLEKKHYENRLEDVLGLKINASTVKSLKK
ncbi:MAG: Unknown protein [uncultured Sulfurovum sp.]|uniref:Uncharacterized protein n=1 Tax=uncultured Sulfurovum sp. TaxID=269237 RepID=A0A6S6SN68_9BACT|nr:MAG: Unknown protein [uncultured Sulfurovum sp.]